MDCLEVHGGTRLCGSVRAGGSKNAALPIMAASILAQGPVHLRRVPELADVNTMALLLGYLGIESKRGLNGTVRIETIDARPTKADYDLVRRMRASICVLGPLVARRGRGVVSLPGGCNIGTRPVNLHLAALEALGAEVRIERGYIVARATRLKGADIDLSGPQGPTVTGTANVMSAATVARGRTIIRSAAREPEIVDLARFLNGLGARIEGMGSDVIEIHGVEQLSGGEYEIIADRIETATLLIAAAITRGSATVRDTSSEHMAAVLAALTEIGVVVASTPTTISVRASEHPQPCSIVAAPYPGIPTDLQAQFMALLSLANGVSIVSDEVFPDRFMHVAELNRLGARIERQGASARVEGVERLSGATVMASDLRASAALVLAGLAARERTTVRRVYHLDRGYAGLEVKLRALGARVVRRDENQPEARPFDASVTDRPAARLVG
jgi:UDP-N-acetylglucosamine 1-carboxyvinyltransferase